MQAQYKKLWKILIDKDMTKQDLSRMANVSGATLTKLRKGENVNVDILIRICTALGCGVDDILEMIPDGSETIERINEDQIRK